MNSGMNGEMNLLRDEGWKGRFKGFRPSGGPPDGLPGSGTVPSRIRNRCILMDIALEWLASHLLTSAGRNRCTDPTGLSQSVESVPPTEVLPSHRQP